VSAAFTGTIQGARDFLGPHRTAGRTIGFVPTMGALHAGHRRLIETARAQSDVVAVSIFVNPLQFDRAADFERYARQIPADLAVCEDAGADLVFAPSAAEMYPGQAQTFVEVIGLTDHFCGASRPGHFRGVTTVVAKLFGIIEPTLAFFGEKDAQQLAIVKRMTRDLNFPITIVPVPTVREPDGLALSSRNVRLTAEERRVAPCLYRALTRAHDLIQSGAVDCDEVIQAAAFELDRPGVRVEYFAFADPETFEPVAGPIAPNSEKPLLALGAIWLGETRLIDNRLCRFRKLPSSA
jgi:pantoate--beta-alanine ligase